MMKNALIIQKEKDFQPKIQQIVKCEDYKYIFGATGSQNMDLKVIFSLGNLPQCYASAKDGTEPQKKKCGIWEAGYTTQENEIRNPTGRGIQQAQRRTVWIEARAEKIVIERLFQLYTETDSH